jgi:hypothetical protein
MSDLINHELIEESAGYSDWYLRLKPYLDELSLVAKQNPDIKDRLVEELRSLFESLVESNKLSLGGSLPLLDENRQNIDTIVIHHTSQPPGLSLARLNVIQLLGIYVPYFQNPSLDKEKYLKGQPITSNHYFNNKLVFWGYHWLIRMDGRFERILPDTAIGWQAGNWQTNCRSVAICLDNDYQTKDPNLDTLTALKSLIKLHYPTIIKPNILGHQEVTNTICPGGSFNTWKSKITE